MFTNCHFGQFNFNKPNDNAFTTLHKIIKALSRTVPTTLIITLKTGQRIHTILDKNIKVMIVGTNRVIKILNKKYRIVIFPLFHFFRTGEHLQL